MKLGRRYDHYRKIVFQLSGTGVKFWGIEQVNCDDVVSCDELKPIWSPFCGKRS